jgi:hypothetical protein
MHEIDAIRTRLQEAKDLPALLTAGFDAFETIRALARSSEEENPALFAALMTAADAAVDGREFRPSAPSRPPGRADPTVGMARRRVAPPVRSPGPWRIWPGYSARA